MDVRYDYGRSQGVRHAMAGPDRTEEFVDHGMQTDAMVAAQAPVEDIESDAESDIMVIEVGTQTPRKPLGTKDNQQQKYRRTPRGYRPR